MNNTDTQTPIADVNNPLVHGILESLEKYRRTAQALIFAREDQTTDLTDLIEAAQLAHAWLNDKIHTYAQRD